MVRTPCRYKEDLNRGAWTAKEDMILTNYIQTHGETGWRSLPKKAGLNRCGKSCRLRWLNYLRPEIKRGNISPDEEELIIRMHRLLGNRWSLIAGRLPGRTDNEIKNYWNTHLSKKLLTMSAVNSKSHMPKQTSDWPQSLGNGCVMKESSVSSDGPLFNLGSGSDGAVSSGEEMSDHFLQESLSLFPDFPENCLATNIEVNNESLLEPSCLEASSQSGPGNGSCSNSSNDLAVPDSAQPEYSMAQDDNSVSSQLNVSYSLHCKSFSLHCIDFEPIQDFSFDSLLQSTAYSLEDICPVEGCDNIVDNSNWFAMGAEQGMTEICNDTLQEPDGMKMKLQQQDCVKWSTQMDLSELCSLLDNDENGNDQLGSGWMKNADKLL